MTGRKLLGDYGNLLHEVLSRTDMKIEINDGKRVKKVCVIVGSSRSGSSLLKRVLSNSFDVVSLSGEEEPFYILSRNGFSFSSDSDSFNSIRNADLIHKLFYNDFSVRDTKISLEDISFRWKNRLLLQLPRFMIDDCFVSKVDELLKNVYDKFESDEKSYELKSAIFIKKLLGKRAGYYDIIASNSGVTFEETFKVEEPPFVIPPFGRMFRESEDFDKVFLFKTPQDCYRIGIFEQLYPNAEIYYVCLLRNYASVVNGLMDGWLCDYGFFAHNLSMHGECLDIDGYTNVKPYGKIWWKFDLPPNWHHFKRKPLLEVCTNQWVSAYRHIIDNVVRRKKNHLIVRFEDFILNPQEQTDRITEFLGISPIVVHDLPLVMITETPKLKRWKKREDLLIPPPGEVIDIMEILRYDLDIETWL